MSIERTSHHRFLPRPVRTLAALLAFALLNTGTGTGQESEAERTIEGEVGIALTLAPTSAEVSATGISPTLRGRYRLGASWFAEWQLGVSFVALQRTGYGSEQTIDFGNPMLGIGYKDLFRRERLSADLTLRAGIPLATFPGNIPDNRLTEFNYNNANSAWGWRDPYLWLMNVVPIAVEGELHADIAENFRGRLLLAPAFLLSVNSRPSGIAAHEILDVALRLKPVTLRMGWTAFLSPTSLENNDHFQHAVFAGVDFTFLGLGMMADFNLNLDQPNGVAASTPKPFWGTTLRMKL